MTERAAVDGALTVGQVAEQFGVTVRTLHHYDEIGLVAPHRTASGYRVYTDLRDREASDLHVCYTITS